MFQSHAGSIEARHVLEYLRAIERGFNPTLVRLRRSLASAASMPASIVSIPRWFD